MTVRLVRSASFSVGISQSKEINSNKKTSNSILPYFPTISPFDTNNDNASTASHSTVRCEHPSPSPSPSPSLHRSASFTSLASKPVLEKTFSIPSSSSALSAKITITKKPETFLSDCRYQRKGWFNAIKIKAELKNLISRTLFGYAAMNVIAFYTGGKMGAVIGTIFGTIVLPGAGTIVGAILGGIVGGLIVSGFSILMKPIISKITHWFRDRGTINYQETITDLKNPNMKSTEKASQLACLLSNCENKMGKFIHNNWSGNGANKNSAMETIMDECIVGKNSILTNNILQLSQEFYSNISPHTNKQNNFAAQDIEPDMQKDSNIFDKDIELKQIKLNKKTSDNKADQDQARSYDVVRFWSALLGHDVPIHNASSSDMNAVYYFPIFSVLNGAIAGGQTKEIAALRKFLTKPAVTYAFVGVSTLATIAELVPTFSEALPDLHGFGVLSMGFSILIHRDKENQLALEDIAIKKKILASNFDPSGQEEFILEDFARVVRHDVTKNIPASLNKLAALVQKSKNIKEESLKKELATEFESTFINLLINIRLAKKYHQYISTAA